MDLDGQAVEQALEGRGEVLALRGCQQALGVAVDPSGEIERILPRHSHQALLTIEGYECHAPRILREACRDVAQCQFGNIDALQVEA